MDNITSIELDKDDSKKYKVEVICNNPIFASKSEAYLPNLYYLVL